MNAFQKVAAVGLLLGTAACTTTDGFQDNAPVNTGTPTAAAADPTQATGGFNPAASNPSIRGTTLTLQFANPETAIAFNQNYPGLIQQSIRASEGERVVAMQDVPRNQRCNRGLSCSQDPGPNDKGYERITLQALEGQTVTLNGVTGSLGDFATIRVTEDQPRPGACPTNPSTVLARAWSPERQDTPAAYAANIRAANVCVGPQLAAR